MESDYTETPEQPELEPAPSEPADGEAGTADAEPSVEPDSGAEETTPEEVE